MSYFGYYTKAGSIYVPNTAPNMAPFLYLNSDTEEAIILGVLQAALPAPAVWNRLSGIAETLGFPTGTNIVALDIRGFLIITDGENTGDADLAVSFEAPAVGQNPFSYDAQTMGAGPTGGSRTNLAVIAPVVNDALDWAWMRGNGGSSDEFLNGAPLVSKWPGGASYGVNLTINAVYTS